MDKDRIASLRWSAEEAMKCRLSPGVGGMGIRLKECLDEIERLQDPSRIFALNKCTRVEVIDEDGRSYVNWMLNNEVDISIQDEGRTLKVFITKG